MDLVIGSRYKTGVNVVNWPIQRVLLSYFGSWYARFITRVPIMDLTSGFVGYKINVIRDIMKKGIEFNGYAYQIEMKFKAHVLNYKLYEIPIIFTDRTKGESKMNKSIIDINGSVLVVSQFTLAANLKSGNRPDFRGAMEPKQAKLLFDHLVQLMKNKNIDTKTGIFGSNMKLNICNDGPVTIPLDIQ